MRGYRLAIVGGEQPILAGTYWYDAIGCFSSGTVGSAFVAPVDPAGASVQNLAPTVWASVPQSQVRDLSPMPDGNIAVLSDGVDGCWRGPEASTLSVLTYGSRPAPALDPAGPQLYLSSLAVDGRGRFLGIASPPTYLAGGTAGQWKLVRLLPDGNYDTSFGSSGGVPLTKFGGKSEAVVVDAKGRPTVGGGEGKFSLIRYDANGKVDHTFAKHSPLKVGFGSGTQATLKAMAIDSKGRILAAGSVTDPALKSGVGVALTRILPGN